MAFEIDKTEFLIKFGKQIQKLKTDKNLILRQLAQNCEIDYNNISKIEKGERNIQMSMILELAKGLNKHPKKLFDFEID